MENKQNSITELVFILDRSGSMHGLESDTIGGFNSMIEKQKAETGTAYVSTALFNQQSTVVHDRVKIDIVKPMTEEDYTVGGCTALLDAVGGAIRHIKMIHKYARPEDVPAHTMFVITTDGLENASHHFTYEQVKAMIEAQKEIGWEFLFVGANMDAVSAASRIGISAERTANYQADQMGTAAVWTNLSAPISDLRNARKIGRAWAESIEADKKHRTKK